MLNQTRRKKILLSKVGVDGHDRGVKVVAAFLRDAGMEVVYLGRYHTIEAVVRSAMQEDVDVIGISLLDGSHLTLVPALLQELKKHKLQSIPVIVGGIVPLEDIPLLKQKGAAEVFPGGSAMSSIIDYISSLP